MQRPAWLALFPVPLMEGNVLAALNWTLLDNSWLVLAVGGHH